MAEVEAVEALVIVLEILIEEGTVEEGSEIAVELAALTEGGDDSPLASTIEDAINNGKTEGEALDEAYTQISQVSQEAADQWAESMAEQGYEFESAQDAEEADFEDTDPDSDPDKGEPETEDCISDPEGEECTLQKQSKLSKFFDFVKAAVPFIVPIAIAIYILIGQLARWTCEVIQKIKGQPETECNSSLCNGVKKMVQFIRTYWVYLVVICVLVGGAATFYFKSLTPTIVFGIGILFVISMKTILGNLFATVLCDVGATTCIVQGKPINC